MAIADISKVATGTALVLTKKMKEFEAGTTVSLTTVIQVQGKPMAMVAVEGGRPFAVPPEALDLPGAAPAAEDTTDVNGPVLEFFNNHADMNDDMAVNFGAAYIETFGAEDTSFITGLVEAAGLPVGQKWTKEQTAEFANEFYSTIGLPVDALVQQALAEAEAERQAAAAKAEAAASAPAETPAAAPAKGRGKKAAAAETPAVATNASVDRAGWDGTHIGALRIASALLPFFAESPDSFNDELALAVKMINAANKTKA